MSTRRKIVLALTLALIGSLGLGAVWQWTSPPYPDLSAYRYDHQSDRLDFIEDVLEEAGLPITEKWLPEFVDRMLRGTSSYRILETAIPTRDFPLFLREAIVTTYYAYSAELHTQAPTPYGEAASRLVRSWFTYPLGYGKEGFRAYIDSLVEAEAHDVFVYQVTGNLHPDTHWTDDLLVTNSRWYIGQYWLDQPIKGFLTMTHRDQARLIRWYWTMSEILAGTTPNQDLLDKIEKEWTERGSIYLRRPAIRDLDRSSPFPRLARAALDEMVRQVE